MNAKDYNDWYQTRRGKWAAQREFALLLEAIRPRAGESVLDVGCGTGAFTRLLASATGGPITGVDINSERLAFARAQNTPGVSYATADARSLPFADRSFDLVVSIAALSFIDDERAALGEMIRVAERKVAIGLFNARSVLWLQKGRAGGRGAYRGARWHLPAQAADLFAGFCATNVRVRTGLYFPGGSLFARIAERLWPKASATGSFIMASADVPILPDRIREHTNPLFPVET